MTKRPAKKPSRENQLPGRAQRFTAVVTSDNKRRLVVPIPFDPDLAWEPKLRHHVAGTLNDCRVRAVIEPVAHGWAIRFGLGWSRVSGIASGEEVTLVLKPEGPQRDDLAPDVAAALEAAPDAGEFFDSLAQFYRKGYLRWIDATKRSPDIRAERIAEMVRLLQTRIKQR